MPQAAEIELVPVTPEAAAAILEGTAPPGFEVPSDYPSEFSAGVAQSAGKEGMVGPFFIRRCSDALVVGELGGAFVDDSTIEIGYAVVGSASGKGCATAAVVAFIARARAQPDAEKLVAHTPLDHPASGRVLSKAGFDCVGQVEDEHEGESITVDEWTLPLR